MNINPKKKRTSEEQKGEQETSKQDEYNFVDINNIIGSKLDLDASDIKSFEKSRMTNESKKKSVRTIGESLKKDCI